MLYQLLGCEESSVYMQKVKGFGLPFSGEKEGFRIDPSKIYKTRPTDRKKMILRQWKQKKASIDPKIDKTYLIKENEPHMITHKERVRLNRSEELPEQESIT